MSSAQHQENAPGCETEEVDHAKKECSPHLQNVSKVSDPFMILCILVTVCTGSIFEACEAYAEENVPGTGNALAGFEPFYSGKRVFKEVVFSRILSSSLFKDAQSSNTYLLKWQTNAFLLQTLPRAGSGTKKPIPSLSVGRFEGKEWYHNVGGYAIESNPSFNKTNVAKAAVDSMALMSREIVSVGLQSLQVETIKCIGTNFSATTVKGVPVKGEIAIHNSRPVTVSYSFPVPALARTAKLKIEYTYSNDTGTPDFPASIRYYSGVDASSLELSRSILIHKLEVTDVLLPKKEFEPSAINALSTITFSNDIPYHIREGKMFKAVPASDDEMTPRSVIVPVVLFVLPTALFIVFLFLKRRS